MAAAVSKSTHIKTRRILAAHLPPALSLRPCFFISPRSLYSRNFLQRSGHATIKIKKVLAFSRQRQQNVRPGANSTHTRTVQTTRCFPLPAIPSHPIPRPFLACGIRADQLGRRVRAAPGRPPRSVPGIPVQGRVAGERGADGGGVSSRRGAGGGPARGEHAGREREARRDGFGVGGPLVSEAFFFFGVCACCLLVIFCCVLRLLCIV